MKKILSRMIALGLAVLLLAGQLITAQPARAAEVNYSKGSADGFNNVIRNWGTRGETADFLSPNALDFYADNDITYEELALLSGSSNTSSVPSSALYKQLQTLMTDNHTRLTDYGNIRYLFAFTDCENNSTNTLSEFYLGKTINSKWDYGKTFNREHCWPKSKTSTPTVDNNTTGEAADIMSQRPADPSTNTGRSNTAYGVSYGYYDPNGKQQYGDDVRGDVARIMLYVYVRWGNTSKMWGSNGVIESKAVLLDWMEEDPVDTWEMGRNDSVESITGTRNVFVDYPELAYQLFNEEVPENYETPSGSALHSYTVTARPNHAACGTVSVSGNVITASPKEGYRVSGYQLLSGTATVTQNGNVFTVVASSDCTVQINFTPKPVYTVTFTENGTVTSTATTYDTVTLPEPEADTGEYSFYGWVTETVNATAQKPYVYAPGAACTPTQNTTFHALYGIRTEVDGEDGGFSLYTGDLTDGTYLLTYNGAAMCAEVSSNRWNYTTITATGERVENVSSAAIWKLEKQTDGTCTLWNEATGMYAAATGVKNQAALNSSITDYAKWTVTGSSVYDFVNLGNARDGVNATLRRNSNYGFATYSTSTGGALTLYRQGGGTMCYTTTLPEPPEKNAIIAQPQSVAVDSGATVQFHVEAQGEVVSYRWEYRQIYKWFNTSMTGYNTDTLTVDATGARNGYDYRCTVTFADGTVIISDMAELTVRTEITNVGDPNDQVVVNGYKGQFTASATGEGLKYRWYYQRPEGTVWSETSMEGCERPTVYIESTAARDGYKYKCKITDVTGNVVYTEIATMRVLTFKSHPQNASGSVGDNVTFSVTTSVDTGFTYQWQYRRTSTASWTNTSMEGYNTDTLTVSVTAARNGYEYRCVLTGSKNSKIESKAAVLTVNEPVKITAQPQNVTCSVGNVAVFTVEATNVASYQWQYQSATSTTRWSNTGATGNKTATLNITATTGNSGYKYRCLITGTDGIRYITEVATLTVH